MSDATERKLGKLAALVETDPRFAAEREVYDFVQQIVAGLKQMRVRRGLTQTQMAEKMGITQGRVSQIESGLLDYAPNLETIGRYAQICNETPYLVFSGDLAPACTDTSEMMREMNMKFLKIVEYFPQQFEIESGDRVIVHGEAAKDLSKALIETGVLAPKLRTR